MITFVNKWDRPGREPLELLDEIEQRIGLRPAPVNWPVGVAGDFRGLIERATGDYVTFTRTPGGAGRAIETRLDAAAAAARDGEAFVTAQEELALLDEIRRLAGRLDMASFLAGVTSPVLFGAALPNFGVRRLLDAVTQYAPPPAERADIKGEPRPVDAPFSGLVFKVQANMDPAHRDRMAFVRVCSGRFERGMVLTHAATGRPFATKYAQSMFGQDRETVEEAFPGDVIGLVNATALRPGDTLYAGESRSSSRPSPASRPSTSRWCAARKRASRSSSGAASSSWTPRASSRSSPPTCAATRPRCSRPSARCSSTWSCTGSSTSSAAAPNSITSTTRMARRTDAEGARALAGQRGVEVLTRRHDGALLALFTDKWRLGQIQREHPDIVLEPLIAG